MPARGSEILPCDIVPEWSLHLCAPLIQGKAGVRTTSGTTVCLRRIYPFAEKTHPLLRTGLAVLLLSLLPRISKRGDTYDNRGGRRKSVAEVSIANNYLDQDVCELLLSVLEANRYCQFHGPQQSTRRVQQWLDSFSSIPSAPRTERAAAANDSPVSRHLMDSLAQRTPNLQARIDKMFELREPSCKTRCLKSMLWPNQTLLEFWPLEPDITPLDIISRVPLVIDDVRFDSSLMDVVVAPLKPQENKAGFVYAYEVEGNNGFVKIGHTTRSIDTRRMEWDEGCNRKATILYPVEPDQFVRVPNAGRIEALCHAELAESRVIIYCHGCLKQHTEWFEVAFDKVKGVIQRWTQWMTTQHQERDSMGRIALGSKWKHGSVDGRKFVPQVNRRPRGSKAPPTQLAMDDLTTHLDSLHVTEACLTPAASPKRDDITTVTADRHHSVQISQRILDEAKP